MDATQLKQYCLNKPEVIEDYPFGPQACVYKIADKMFALAMYRNGRDCVNLKCDPHQANILRDIFEAVEPGYHMNKQHWNTVVLNGSIPPGEIERMVDHSYALVVKKLTKKVRKGLEIAHGPDLLYRNAF